MRLFTGIAPSPPVLNNLARVLKELRPLAAVNWSPVENLHITGKFIGAWPEDRLGELKAALGKMQPPVAFEVTIAGFGYFPNARHPRTLYAGVHAAPGLAELASGIDACLQPLGVAGEDKAYAPHLTLARVKQSNIGTLREHIANMTNFDFGSFLASEFHLYLSNTGPKGSVYTPLATYPLATAASRQA